MRERFDTYVVYVTHSVWGTTWTAFIRLHIVGFEWSPGSRIPDVTEVSAVTVE